MISKPRSNRARRSGLGFLASTIVGAFALAMAGSSHGVSIDTADSPFSIDDFSVGRTLVATQGSGLQSVLLDLDVYRRSVEPGLADLRVFDGRGLAVPYAIRRRVPERVTKQQNAFQSIPLFTLETGEGDETTGISGDFRLDAELSDSGAIVSVHRTGTTAAAADARPGEWLLDASQLKRSISAIEFVFGADDDAASSGEGAADFVSRIDVESSNDLALWKPVDADIVVARLAQGMHRIEQFEFDVPATRARYFRLRASAPSVLPQLAAVRVRKSAKTRREAAPKAIERVVGVVDPDAPRVVVFDLGGAPSIESLRVSLPVSGTIIDGRLESSSDLEGPWTSRGREVFYHYEREGIAFRNPKREWGGGRHRYVRLVTTPRGGGLQGQIPELDVEWVPDQLVYLERGTGPSTLAIGRHGARDASFSPDQLLRTLRSGKDVLREATAELGDERVLGGPSVLEPPPEPFPWRTYGLWGLLIAIVAIVMGLGLHLLRSQSATSDREATGAPDESGTDRADSPS